MLQSSSPVLLDVNEVVDVVFVLLRMGLLGVDGDKRGQVGESRSKLKKIVNLRQELRP